MSGAAAYVNDVIALFDGWNSTDDSTQAVTQSYGEQMARVREGDADAFEEIVLAFTKQLDVYALRFVTSSDASADLVQDVFAHLWEHRASIRVRTSVRAYLYTAVRNRALDIRKRQRAEEASWAAAQIVGAPAGMSKSIYETDAEVHRGEIAERVAAAIGTLPPRAREVALLRWRDGLSRAEIGAIMGIAVPTVNNQLTIAANVARALLADLREENRR